MADNVFKIGASLATLTDIEALTTPLLAPAWTYSAASAQAELASGAVRDMGFPVITWHWAFLTDAQWDQLRTFCSGRSATAFIQSPDNTITDTIYQTIMVWPAGDDISAELHLDVTIEFRRCVKQVV